jgi:DNA-binding CsgD family transcriptional regulator
LSELVGSIYDCTLDPRHWDHVLPGIRDALDCNNVVLSLTDLSGGRLMLGASIGIEPAWMARILEHVPEINARLSEALAWWPSLDEPFVISQHLSAEYLAKSPYYNDCVRRQGLVDIMSYYLMASPTRYSAIAAARHERHGYVGDRQLEIGRLLIPHLRRAVTISNVLDARTVESARMSEALDALSCGVVLTTVSGNILHANRSAEDRLSEGRALRGTGGSLSAGDDAAAKELRTAIKVAARDEAALGKTGLAIPLVEPEKDTVFAHVLPLAAGDLRTRLEPEAVAAVFVGAPDERDGANLVAKAYGLTPAETRVLAEIAAGASTSDAAATLGIAGSTVRTHLESIFAKTGVKRQAELVRLAARLAPPTRSEG